MLNSNALPSPSVIEPKILAEAAEWLTLLHSSEVTEQDRAELKQWQTQSPMHQAAWQRAEAVIGTFQRVPSALGYSTLSQVSSTSRRRAIKALALLLITTPTAWVTYRQKPWQEWQADLHTVTGEQVSKNLADGTHLVLNTDSAVDVAFSDFERRVTLLAGEVLITTGKDSAPSYRPFIVNTPQGSLQALGTRFTVRRLTDLTQLAVFEGAVKIHPIGSSESIVVSAGEQRVFSATHIQPAQTVTENALLWQQGMLLAKDMRLGDLITELSRYRSGVLRCDPTVADLLVSGAFQVNDTQASLDLLTKTLPVKISSITPWWVTVQPQ